MAFRLLLERLDQAGCVRDDQYLGAAGGKGDQAPESRQQIGMEARLGLIQHK